uniref:Uncharacterized protein n=1 Tax=Heterorhabditis bacteriophora TaxID=37862 RepID=A0A1I7W7Q7_HETBA
MLKLFGFTIHAILFYFVYCIIFPGNFAMVLLVSFCLFYEIYNLHQMNSLFCVTIVVWQYFIFIASIFLTQCFNSSIMPCFTSLGIIFFLIENF